MCVVGCGGVWVVGGGWGCVGVGCLCVGGGWGGGGLHSHTSETLSVVCH